MPNSRCSVQQSNPQFLKSGTLIFILGGLMLEEVIKGDWPSIDLQTWLGWSRLWTLAMATTGAIVSWTWPLAKLNENSGHNCDWLSGSSVVWLPARPGHRYYGNDGGPCWPPGWFWRELLLAGHPLGGTGKAPRRKLEGYLCQLGRPWLSCSFYLNFNVEILVVDFYLC